MLPLLSVIGLRIRRFSGSSSLIVRVFERRGVVGVVEPNRRRKFESVQAVFTARFSLLSDWSFIS